MDLEIDPGVDPGAARKGHQVSEFVVRRLLREGGYSLQANAKTAEGRQHPDRDAQFAHINNQAEEHIAAGQPVISVDGKKKSRHEVADSE